MSSIEACIASCLQEKNQNVEVIVLDNQSNDGTFSVALKYEAPNVRILQNNENLGAYGNHNRIMKLAEGEYIKFLHSDDTLNPGAIGRFLNEIKKHPEVDFFAFNTCFKKKSGAIINIDNYKYDIFLKDMAPENFVKFGTFLGTPSMTLFKKSLISKIGEFDAAMEPAADAEFWDRTLQNALIKLCAHYVVTITDDVVTLAQSYRLNFLFFTSLLRRLKLLEKNCTSPLFNYRISEFKLRTLFNHLYLSVKLGIVNLKFGYMLLVINEIVQTLRAHPVSTFKLFTPKVLSLNKGWFDELAKYSNR